LFVILSAAKNLSVVLCSHQNRRGILRSAQNDNAFCKIEKADFDSRSQPIARSRLLEFRGFEISVSSDQLSSGGIYEAVVYRVSRLLPLGGSIARAGQRAISNV
jgi:hypothetical protein